VAIVGNAAPLVNAKFRSADSKRQTALVVFKGTVTLRHYGCDAAALHSPSGGAAK
jgi:hypothetical protein